MTFQEFRKWLKEPFFKFEEVDNEVWAQRECFAVYTVMGLAGWGILYGIYWLAT